MPSPLNLFAATLGSLALIIGLAAPVEAAPRATAPYITAASTHTLTVAWPKVAGTKKYTLNVASSPARTTKSWARKQTAKKRTTVKVRKLQPGRRYCFAVRAVLKGSRDRRSPPVCGYTLKRRLDTSAPRVSVATFNVCAKADNCRGWSKRRENAVVRRILDADAEVVALQEVTGKADRLARRLASHGYAHYTNKRKRDEAIYYRRDRLALDLESRTTNTCRTQPYAGDADTTSWRFPRHFDAPTQQWYAYGPTGWYSEQKVCRTRTYTVEREGRIGSPTGATAAWAALRLKRTGTAYIFVSAHLSHGRAKSDDRRRGRETRQLIAKTEKIAGADPVIFMGDFNSYRGSTVDLPRKAMAKAGWFDTYDRSTTYRQPFVNSLNRWRPKVTPARTWNGHIDRIFIRGSMGSSKWRVVAKISKRRAVGTLASDHHPVRATIYLS